MDEFSSVSFHIDYVFVFVFVAASRSDIYDSQMTIQPLAVTPAIQAIFKRILLVGQWQQHRQDFESGEGQFLPTARAKIKLSDS